MSTLNKLQRPARSWHRKKRVGRGQGSGLGKTAGRGGKGQKARSGNMRFEGFEGGQSPLQRRLPKFGFTPPNRTVYAVVNLSDLEQHFDAGATADVETLRKVGLVKGRYHGVKLLARGELTKKVTVVVHKASEAAKAAIQKAGGAVEEIPLVAHKPESAAKAHAGKGVKAPRQPKA
ncbi:50S ribosomal protein L15 [Myxococcus sp. AM001]|uniref:Large ribosomal subunit protein uL15 n=1 Tax=Myxococcus xanthus TaxID=34 RepID=A0AAE6KSL3_MYXXA|nr:MULTISPECIES: 50S ribosomal protein L15 [Myxococcus]NVJ06325.1 50S ribosomal protein L15 [Myxococcus sp. AM001]NVJ00446.1 50S ribosomal protein L15 [Myxococcus sp. AM009]NVJ17324.1 50S ribosomal protein L15 [Myxococcus sp. AM010]QDE68408.1 50S ribosomal protein L15 [Myxococcus xanthus]QDE75685.1 50S ribosomal protein L15 [Myxococcus xanthus]